MKTLFTFNVYILAAMIRFSFVCTLAAFFRGNEAKHCTGDLVILPSAQSSRHAVCLGLQVRRLYQIVCFSFIPSLLHTLTISLHD